MKPENNFYKLCLSELKARPDYTDAYIPILKRYVLLTQKAEKLGDEILKEDLTISYINLGKNKNTSTNPKVRMFFLLNNQCNELARVLMLSPISAPPPGKKANTGEKFDLKKAA